LSDYFPVYVYFILVLFVTIAILAVSALSLPALFGKSKKKDTEDERIKHMPYESGIQTTTNLLQERFPLRHYLVALIFLVFDVEVIFLYPWAVVSKNIGPFAFYEMAFFLAALLVGFAYVWKKGGLEWE
jgi:NADH:ubiquinone oxidoreductase subunit 3 (subunit A)